MIGFALLYFTGSDHFNRSMRFYANLKGLSLSDTGLQPVNRVSGKRVHTFPSYRWPLLHRFRGVLGYFPEQTLRASILWIMATTGSLGDQSVNVRQSTNQIDVRTRGCATTRHAEFIMHGAYGATHVPAHRLKPQTHVCWFPCERRPCVFTKNLTPVRLLMLTSTHVKSRFICHLSGLRSFSGVGADLLVLGSLCFTRVDSW